MFSTMAWGILTLSWFPSGNGPFAQSLSLPARVSHDAWLITGWQGMMKDVEKALSMESGNALLY
jgi:hypothetical protein